ncbi:MAG: hypothetical protein RIS47_1738 [Bacteroidota bacterium]|jgi:molecular chaperone HtpG
MSTGTIGVTTENIFPIIKKFLYSDHEIFLREIVANAVDATQKLTTLARIGEFTGDVSDVRVKVELNKEAKTITVTDQGIGMTEEEVEKYINQIAFSSANDFLEKYKNQANAIIGHFGLGFYSSFMVSTNVEVNTKSYKEDAPAVRWECDGSPNYTISPSDKQDVGTQIVMHIDEESIEFLDEARLNGLLTKYCKFLPVSIVFAKDSNPESEKLVNNTSPLWVKTPVDVTDEQYKAFYSELYPGHRDPLFNIHLNVDYPFNLTGILYFPKLTNTLEVQKNKIQLYCNQVFVTDSVEGIVPDFLTLLHGVLDSPDIPLNVSRSYLQSDSNVKKISSHITKKVADRLHDIFKTDREQFEKKWDDLKLFVQYGMLTDEKFYDKATKFFLFKNTDGKYFTMEEYKDLITLNQTDKSETLVYLYATNRDDQFSYIKAAQDKAYDVLILDGHFDIHFINHLESKLEKSNFKRVDADVANKLIEKLDGEEVSLSDDEVAELRPVFGSQVDMHYWIQFENLGENTVPMLLTQSEFMRRMKDMEKVSGMSMYGNLPSSYNLIINSDHPLVKRIITEKNESLSEQLAEFAAQAAPLEAKKIEIDLANSGKKDEEIQQADKDLLESLNSEIEAISNKKEDMLKEFGGKNPIIKQMIDLAKLSNNMLRGEELDAFVRRSLDLIS